MCEKSGVGTVGVQAKHHSPWSPHIAFHFISVWSQSFELELILLSAWIGAHFTFLFRILEGGQVVPRSCDIVGIPSHLYSRVSTSMGKGWVSADKLYTADELEVHSADWSQLVEPSHGAVSPGLTYMSCGPSFPLTFSVPSNLLFLTHEYIEQARLALFYPNSWRRAKSEDESSIYTRRLKNQVFQSCWDILCKETMIFRCSCPMRQKSHEYGLYELGTSSRGWWPSGSLHCWELPETPARMANGKCYGSCTSKHLEG